jgi:hypothetical protein
MDIVKGYSGSFVADSSGELGERWNWFLSWGTQVNNLGLAYTGSLTQAVPETSTWVMMILGFFGEGLARYHSGRIRSV